MPAEPEVLLPLDHPTLAHFLHVLCPSARKRAGRSNLGSHPHLDPLGGVPTPRAYARALLGTYAGFVSVRAEKPTQPPPPRTCIESHERFYMYVRLAP